MAVETGWSAEQDVLLKPSKLLYVEGAWLKAEPLLHILFFPAEQEQDFKANKQTKDYCSGSLNAFNLITCYEFWQKYIDKWALNYVYGRDITPMFLPLQAGGSVDLFFTSTVCN